MLRSTASRGLTSALHAAKQRLKPKERLESLFQLTPEWLQARGLKGVILDLDNTVVPYKFRGEPSAELVAWVEGLKRAGVKLFLVSNARRKRLAYWSEKLGVAGTGLAFKPWFGFKKGLRRLGLSPREVVVVGDQLFTDVLGGNLAGLHTVLVPPLSRRELGYTRLVRRLERWVLQQLG